MHPENAEKTMNRMILFACELFCGRFQVFCCFIQILHEFLYNANGFPRSDCDQLHRLCQRV